MLRYFRTKFCKTKTLNLIKKNHTYGTTKFILVKCIDFYCQTVIMALEFIHIILTFIG